MTFYDRVSVETTTQGSDNLTLGTATPGYRTFAAAGIPNGSTVNYVIENGINWEIGTGTYTSGTLSRTPISSTNGNALIDLIGTSRVFIDVISKDLNLFDNTRNSIYGASTKSTVVNGDTVGIIDSEDSHNLKQVSFENFQSSVADNLADVATSGNQDDMSDGTTNKNFTATEKTKLADAIVAANNLSDVANAATARTNIAAAADPVTPDFTNAVPVALKLVTQDHVSPAWFGLTGGSTEDTAYTRALTAAIVDNKPCLVEADHTLDVVDLSGVDAGGTLRILHTGKLTQIGASSADLFNFGTRDVVEIFGPGEFDGQKDSQTANRIIIPLSAVDKFHGKGLTFRNVKRGAVHQQNPLATSFILEDFACYEGGLHNGVINDLSCEFVLIRSGLYARVSRFRMIQTADPAANTNRNPAGIFYINSGANPGSGQVVIEDGYLENLGYSSAGNHAGMIDFYTRAEKIDLKRLTFRKSRFLPIRTNYAKIISISECDAEVPSQMYYNDTTAYSDAAAYSIGMVDRGYATDGGHIEQATIEKSVALISGNHNCRAVSASCGDNDYLFKKLVLDTNNFQHTGTNTAPGVFTSVVVDVEEINPTTEGFDIGTRTQGTSTVGTAAASENAVYRRSGGRTKGGSTGFYARDLAANLNVTLDNATMSGQSGSVFTIRNVGDVLVVGGDMGGGSLDTTGNDNFTMRDVAGAPSSVGGLTANDAFSIRNCPGIGDRDSWSFGSGVTTLNTDADATLTPSTTGRTVIHTGTLTANRTLTPSTTGAKAGLTEFYVARTGSGAFNLSVGGLKNLATGQWCIVRYNGSAYVLIAFGSL